MPNMITFEEARKMNEHSSNKVTVYVPTTLESFVVGFDEKKGYAPVVLFCHEISRQQYEMCRHLNPVQYFWLETELEEIVVEEAEGEEDSGYGPG